MNVRKMKIMSSIDILTGVYNRNAMNNRISEDLNGSNPIPRSFGICFIDVNGLKATNDLKGHEAGDNLLKDVAVILNGLKTPDTDIYRVGGDDIIKAMQKADCEMYAVKAEYYSRHPEMDWHNSNA